MRQIVKELHITVGLPASGKTTWSNELVKAQRDLRYFDCDHRVKHNNVDSVEGLIQYMPNYGNGIVCDGLFLTKTSISDLLKAMAKEKIKVDKVFIQYWEPDIEACLWNDRGRRDEDSKITIKNAKIDYFNKFGELATEFRDIKFKFIKHEIVMKEPHKIFAEKHMLHMDEHGKATGDSWCQGGTWCDCWENSGTVSAEAQPEFSLLDDLMAKECPTITFLQHKRLTSLCVDTEDYGEGDYYGGHVSYSKYVVDVKALYDFLVEEELISAESLDS